MIWLALLIPIIAIIFLAIKHANRMHIVEYIVLFLVPTIAIFVGKSCSVHSQTKDTEFWNSYGTSAMYEEEWRERWTEIETYTVTVGSGKNQRTETRTRLVTKTAHHPEKWTLFDNTKNSYGISKSYFEQLCTLWGNRVFKDMQRGKSSGHTITKNGNAYITTYDNVFDHIIPICKAYSYENKIQCSKSVFNFRDVSPEDIEKYKLFDYPSENLFNYNPILGCSNPIAIKKLQKYNALNGLRRQIHMLLVVFDDQPLEAGLFQESLWKGGNKNEFILCVGKKGEDIKWTKIISWTEQDELKIRTAREIKEMKKFDAVKIVDYMGQNIPKSFLRKNFKDFSYIAIRPTSRAIIITYIITLVTTLIVACFSLFNKLEHYR